MLLWQWKIWNDFCIGILRKQIATTWKKQWCFRLAKGIIVTTYFMLDIAWWFNWQGTCGQTFIILYLMHVYFPHIWFHLALSLNWFWFVFAHSVNTCTYWPFCKKWNLCRSKMPGCFNTFSWTWVLKCVFDLVRAPWFCFCFKRIDTRTHIHTPQRFHALFDEANAVEICFVFTTNLE